ncbi:unnamed protein product [Peronospora destructor]|uniref:Uncharacterized protein n=1 Tax=Peronospora destructor TaxID=86335 RepID=A0AAV0U0K3_9STRA|nr:unnamed protein product [Peronospora destructor]
MSQLQPQDVAPRSMDSGTPPPSRRRRDRGSLMKLKKGGDDGKKSLLEAIFFKKKNVNGPPSSTTPIQPISTPNPAAVARGVAILHSIFPKWESETLQVVLEANGTTLRLPDDDEAKDAPSEEGNADEEDEEA